MFVPRPQISYECSSKARESFINFYSSMLKTLVAEAPTVGSSESKYRKVESWFNECRQYYELFLLFLESLLTTMRFSHGTMYVIKSTVNRSLYYIDYFGCCSLFGFIKAYSQTKLATSKQITCLARTVGSQGFKLRATSIWIIYGARFASICKESYINFTKLYC